MEHDANGASDTSSAIHNITPSFHSFSAQQVSASSHRHHRSHGRSYQIMIIMRMLMNLDKRITVNRLAILASAFYCWKHGTISTSETIDRPISSGVRRYSSYISSDRTELIKEEKGGSDLIIFPSSNLPSDAYQKKYLALFAENEQLRLQLQELKKSTRQKNEALRKKGSQVYVL